MDAGKYEAIEQSRRDAERRRDAIHFGDLFARCAATVWRGRRISHGPAQELRYARFAMRLAVSAAGYYQDAGLGRQAALLGRVVAIFGRRYHGNTSSRRRDA